MFAIRSKSLGQVPITRLQSMGRDSFTKEGGSSFEMQIAELGTDSQGIEDVGKLLFVKEMIG